MDEDVTTIRLKLNNDSYILYFTYLQYDVEQLDSRGRTPLMLAVRLCHLQSVKALLAAKCNANAEHDGWSVVQEAVCTGDPLILTAILEVRDLQRHQGMWISVLQTKYKIIVSLVAQVASLMFHSC